MNTPVYNSFVEKDAEFIDIENSKIETREELEQQISCAPNGSAAIRTAHCAEQ